MKNRTDLRKTEETGMDSCLHHSSSTDHKKIDNNGDNLLLPSLLCGITHRVDRSINYFKWLRYTCTMKQTWTGTSKTDHVSP